MILNKKSEVFRSPRGFVDRYRGNWDFDARLIEFARKLAEINCFDPLATAPVGYASTFENVKLLASDRTYPLSDLSGRNLMLAPDSTASILRWLSEFGLYSSYNRIMFNCPVFRYRRTKYRYTHHLGFAITNEPMTSSFLYNPAIRVLIVLMHKLLSNFEPRLVIELTDLSVWHQLLSEEISDDKEIKRLMYKLRFKDKQGQEELITKAIYSKSLKKHLIGLLKNENNIDDYSCMHNGFDLLGPLKEMKSELKKLLNVDILFNFGCMHGSELQSGITFRFYNHDNIMFADGGCYSDYAKAFNAKTESFFSTATSVEYLREIYNRDELLQNNKICILYWSDFKVLAQELLDNFQSINVPAFMRVVRKSQLKSLNALKGENIWYFTIGKNEVSEDQITLKYTNSNFEKKIKISELDKLNLDKLNKWCPSSNR